MEPHFDDDRGEDVDSEGEMHGSILSETVREAWIGQASKARARTLRKSASAPQKMILRMWTWLGVIYVLPKKCE